MASITITETGVRTQVNVYRNMNGAGPTETKVTISGWSEHDGPADVPGRKIYDEDVTARLTPAQKATFDQIMDVAEAWLKNHWNIG